MTNDDGQPKPLSDEVVAEIRKQAISQVSKWAILAFVALIGIALSGWWFYLQQKVDEYIATHAAGVPPSAVVAFDAPSRCPNGWTEFEPAAGNVVVGISAKHHYRDAGGFETHQLKVSELPPHQVAFNVDAAASSGVDRYNAGGHDYWVITKAPTPIKIEVGGNGDAISTMPPYVTLRYCKKD